MYDVPAQVCRNEIVIKKSRFISQAAPCADRAIAMTLLESSRNEFSDASHHCWAYIIGNPHSAVSAATSDDGEPSGTAGKPILNVLNHKLVGDCMDLVVRYFGGIKLGSGGLVRAYSSAAQSVMEKLSTIKKIDFERIRLHIEYSQEQELRYWLEQNNGKLHSMNYQPYVMAEVDIPAGISHAFKGWAMARKITFPDDL
ncbi:MAG: putative YigZ family protein [Parasphingorhabdus sp.]|jgi:uncharacterized YigZ family protein